MKQRVTVALLGASMGVLAGCAVPFVSGDARGSNIGGVEDPAGANGGGGGAVDSGVAAATAAGASGDARHGKASKADGHGAGILPPLGPFDPTEPGFVVFDPCTEISDEQLQVIGLERDQSLEPLREPGLKACVFNFNDGSAPTASVGLSTIDQSLDYFLAGNADKVSEWSSKDVPQLKFLTDMTQSDFECNLYVETQRGLFSVSWIDLTTQSSFARKCALAESILLELV